MYKMTTFNEMSYLIDINAFVDKNFIVCTNNAYFVLLHLTVFQLF